MERVIAFIDGFNVYHSLVDANLNSYKWLNYYDLSSAFIKKKTQQLVGVYYFSALAPWDVSKLNRHKEYIRALRHVGVNIVLGRFKNVTRTCRTCKARYKTFEEKETDVNIAVYMLKLAMLDNYDTALLFSGDSDLIPAVKEVKSTSPHKNIHVIIPYKRSAIDLMNSCDDNSKIKKHHLSRNQFPDTIVLDSKRGINISKPKEWV